MNSPGSPQATSGRQAPHPAPPLGHCSLIIFAVCRLCFLPVPITFCSAVLSLLNDDKCVLSFISVSSPASRQPTLYKAARGIFPQMYAVHLFPVCVPGGCTGPGRRQRPRKQADFTESQATPGAVGGVWGFYSESMNPRARMGFQGFASATLAPSTGYEANTQLTDEMYCIDITQCSEDRQDRQTLDTLHLRPNRSGSYP